MSKTLQAVLEERVIICERMGIDQIGLETLKYLIKKHGDKK